MKTIKAQKYGIDKDGKSVPIMITDKKSGKTYPYTSTFTEEQWERMEQIGSHPWKKFTGKPDEIKVKALSSKNKIGGGDDKKADKESEAKNDPGSKKEIGGGDDIEPNSGSEKGGEK